MVDNAEGETFISDRKPATAAQSQSCTTRWWNQYYRPQKAISRAIESNYFRAIVIFLVVVDASLVVAEILLDSFKLHYECEGHIHKQLRHQYEHIVTRIEAAILVIHYTSIGILLLFVVEVFVKIYAFGREFWNYHRRKMEYFDAVIVIVSFAIDVYFLQGEEKILHNRLPLVLSFRLWRFVRIISSVAEGINDGHVEHRERLNKEYLRAIDGLINIVQSKTSYIESNENDDAQSTSKYFHGIDGQCQTAFKRLKENQELTSSASVKQFIKDIDGIGNAHTSVIPSLFSNTTDV